MFWSGFVGMKFVVAVLSLAGLSWLICMNLIGADQLHYDHQQRAALDYVKRAVPRIIEKWDFQALKDRTTPELQVSDSWKKMPGKFRLYKKELGKVIEYQDLVGTIELDTTSGEELLLGAYAQRARFQHGTGDIAVVVIKRNGSWKLHRFSVRSAILPANLDDDQ